MRYEGIWQRANRNDNMTYFDLDGNVLALRPGTTWVQVVPLFFERLIVEP